MKRVLIIAYHFGPTGPVGGFRWFVQSRQLVDAGWTVDVIVEQACTGIAAPETRDMESTGRFRLFVVPSFQPGGWLLRIPGWLRNSFLRRRPERSAAAATEVVSISALPVWRPGTKPSLSTLASRSLSGLGEYLHLRRWAKDAGRLAARLARECEYRAVIVSTPPHFVQEAGIRLRRRAPIPFVADLRDPWISGLGSTVEYFDPITRILGKWHEARLIRSADVLIHNTPRAAKALRDRWHRGPLPRQVVIGNGYERIADTGLPDRGVFRVLFGGSLYPFMDVRVLFDACARLRDTFGLSPEMFRIEFLGTDPNFAGTTLPDIAAAYGLALHTEVVPAKNREDAIRHAARAAALVAFDFWHRTAVVMKFLDYAQLRGGMLLIGDPDSALGDAARQLDIEVYDRDDPDAVTAALVALYQRWKAGHFPDRNDKDGVFDRARRIRELQCLLDEVEGP